MHFLKIDYQVENPKEHKRIIRQMQSRAEDFDDGWNRRVNLDLSLHRSFHADLPLNYSCYGLPENTGDETFVSILWAYYLTKGLSPEEILRNGGDYDRERFDREFREQFYLSPLILMKREDQLTEEDRNEIRRVKGRQREFFADLLDRIRNLEIPLPDKDHIDPQKFFRDAARARLYNRLAGLEDYLEKYLEDESYQYQPQENPFPPNAVTQKVEDLYNGLMGIFGQRRFAGEQTYERTLPEEELKALHCFWAFGPQARLPLSFRLADQGNTDKVKWVMGIGLPQDPIPGQSEIVRNLLGDHEPETTYLDLDTNAFLGFITHRKVDSPRAARRALSKIYINGRCLRGMDPGEAADAIKECLDVNSTDVVTVARRKRPHGEEKPAAARVTRDASRRTAGGQSRNLQTPGTDSARMRIVDPGYAMTRDRRRPLTYAADAFAAYEKKLQRDQAFLEEMLRFDPAGKGDVKIIRAPEYSRAKNVQPAQQQIQTLQFLERVTGCYMNLEDPLTLKNAIQSIYINGKNLYDQLQTEPTAEQLGVYAEAVSKALEPESASFVTIMNRNSLVPMPRAVLPAGNLTEEPRRSQVMASVGFVRRFHEGMSRTVEKEKDRLADLAAKNTELFQPASQEELLIGGNQLQPAYALQALYMMSQGYSWEAAFGDDPSYDDDKRRLGAEFTELFSRRKSLTGRPLPLEAPQNQAYYKDRVEPVLMKMAETIAAMKPVYLDINQKENLSRLGVLGQAYDGLAAFCQSVETSPYTEEVKGLTSNLGAAVSLFGKNTRLQLEALEAGLYRSAGKGRGQEETSEAYFYDALFRHDGDPTAFYQAPFGTISLTAEQGKRLNDFLEREGRVNPWLEEYEKYGQGKPNAYEARVFGPQADPVVKDALHVLRASASVTNTGRTAAETAERAALMNACQENAREAYVFDWEEFYECRNDDGTKLLSTLAGYPLRPDSSALEIQTALEKIYVNDRSLKEYLQTGDSVDAAGLQRINERLKALCNDAFLNQKDENQKSSVILRKGADGRFQPVYLDYGNMTEPAPVRLMEANEGTEAERTKNLDAYNRYTAAKATFAMREELIKDVEPAIIRARAYAKKLSCEKLDENEKAVLAGTDVVRPAQILTSAELEAHGSERSQGKYIVDRLMGGSEEHPLAPEALKDALRNIYINDQNLAEYFHVSPDNVQARDIRWEIGEKLVQVLKEEFLPGSSGEGKKEPLFVAVKGTDGVFRPVTLEEPVPDIRPEVEEYSWIKRLFSSSDKVEENRREREAYLKSVQNHETAVKTNKAFQEANETARIYSGALNWQQLKEEEKKLLEEKGVRLPHEELYYGAKEAQALRNGRTRQTKVRTNVNRLAENEARPAVNRQNNSRSHAPGTANQRNHGTAPAPARAAGVSSGKS